MKALKAKYSLSLVVPKLKTPPPLWTPTHSWVKQFMQILRVQLAYVDDVAVRGTDNALHTIDATWGTQTMSINSPITQDAYGPMLGRGDNAESPTDYDLQTQVIHGVGANQMQYGATSVGVVTIDASDIYVDASRTFTNGSGGGIVVKEIGLVCFAQTREYLLIRDVLAVPVTVPDTGLLTLTYRVQVTN